jgi:D-mannonate dehydratase
MSLNHAVSELRYEIDSNFVGTRGGDEAVSAALRVSQSLPGLVRQYGADTVRDAIEDLKTSDRKINWANLLAMLEKILPLILPYIVPAAPDAEQAATAS